MRTRQVYELIVSRVEDQTDTPLTDVYERCCVFQRRTGGG